MNKIRTFKQIGLIALLSLGFIIGGNAKAEIVTDDIHAYAKAEVTIERLRKQDPVDWNAIAAQYDITSAIVTQIGERTGMLYDQEIRGALTKCAAGEKVKVNQQVLAKGLQHVTVLAITGELDLLGKSDVVGERIAAYFEGIRPTFVRRDTDFFGDSKTLETLADQAIQGLLNTQSADMLTARRELEDVIARTYALSVLYEIMAIEKLRDSDLDTCEVKLKEAEVFYRIIQPRIARGRAKSAEIITNMLKGSYQTMDAAILENELERGLRGITLR